MAIDYIAMLSCYLKGSPQTAAVLSGPFTPVEMTSAIAPNIPAGSNLIMHDQAVTLVVPKTLDQFPVSKNIISS